MPTVVVSPTPTLQWVDVNGEPLVGGLLFTYAGGTTTKTPTYTDSTGTTPNTNPIVLNALGEPPHAVFIPVSMNIKFVLAPPGCVPRTTIFARISMTGRNGRGRSVPPFRQKPAS